MTQWNSFIEDVRELLTGTSLAVFLVGLILVGGCGENPSEPGRENPYDAQHPETSGDPFGLTATVEDSAVTLHWKSSPNPEVCRYFIFRGSRGSGGLVSLASVDSAAISYRDESVRPGRTYTYKIQAQNIEGNQTDVSAQLAVTVHTSGLFTINGGEATTPSRAVVISVVADDCDSLWIWNEQEEEDGQWFRKCGGEALVDWQLAAGPGRRLVNARLHFRSGQHMTVMDTIGQAAFTGGLDLAAGSQFTALAEVTLRLWEPTAVLMKIAESPELFATTPWEIFDPSERTWEFTKGDGMKSLFVQFRNDFESESPVYSDEVFLDQTPPLANLEPPFPDNGDKFLRNPVDLSWAEGSDEGSGIRRYRVLVDSANPPLAEVYRGEARQFQAGVSVPHLWYYWQVVVEDRAGNLAAGPVWKFMAMPIDQLVRIPAGTFTMGSPDDEYGHMRSETQHQVTFPGDYYISPHEVTTSSWYQLMGTHPGYGDWPAERISWLGAVEYCNRLSVQQGLRPVYDLSNPGVAIWDTTANGYRLPTEAEWEYACRAGTTTAFASGPMLNPGDSCNEPALDPIGFYCGNAYHQTWEVGTLDPNAWGLFDMHGNILEWCWDEYEVLLGTAPVNDPVTGGYEAELESSRVLRGGAVSNSSDQCRSAKRYAAGTSFDNPRIGFRVARSVR